MELLGHRLRYRFLSMVDDVIDAAEVVHRLNDIVHVDRLVCHADSVRLEDVARLFMRQTASLHVVGVIGHVNLCAMVDTTFQPRILLLT